MRLAVYDLSGRRVATLADGVQAAGTLIRRWDGRSDAGEEVAPRELRREVWRALACGRAVEAAAVTLGSMPDFERCVIDAATSSDTA